MFGDIMISNEEDTKRNDQNICIDIREQYAETWRFPCNNPPVRGRYVTINLRSYRFRDIRLCELKVLSCPAGSWGYNITDMLDCSQTCDGCRGEETCRVEDGNCYSGCKNGSWGRLCDQSCDCAGDEPCNMLDGYCESGCRNSYWGVPCNQSCNCISDGPCRMSDGYCEIGCRKGSWGISCDRSCDCKVDQPCDQQNGTCTLSE